MIILKLKAGLGNQMFQYAHARALALQSGTELKLDLSWYDNQPAKDTRRYYGLSHFNIQADTAASLEAAAYSSPAKILLRKAVQKIKRGVFGYSDFVFHPAEAKAVSPTKNMFIEGYWNSEKYFMNCEAAIRSELTLREPLGLTALGVKKEIELAVQKELIPVLVHVRRGDYVSNPHASSFHGVQGAAYFKEALEELAGLLGDSSNRIMYFVSSDDAAWVKENIPFEHPTYFISHPDIRDYEEMYLMSLCSHFIISNSTFSWWGAWLSTSSEKIVIGPKRWVADPRVNTRDVMPDNWVRI